METVRAIYEHGVFRPIVPVKLPERAEYDFEPRPVVPQSSGNGPTSDQIAYSEDGLRKVYQILSERYASGHTDTAARHNDHQP